jgi:hypothetical protein
MPRLPALPLLLSLVLPGLAAAIPAHAAGRDDFYQGSAIVSGTTMATRPEGLSRALADVLVKVSGNPALRDDPRVAKLDAVAMLQDYAYLDRQTDLPRRDEQGSRDRPYTLIAHFDPVRVDAALKELGEKPWTGERPPLFIRVAVQGPHGNFRMTAEGDDDERHRQALLAAAEHFGMRVILPPAEHAEDAKAPAGAVVLNGTLVWSDPAFGWVGKWRLDWQGKPHEWSIEGVSFDMAFRNAILGSMAAMTGHKPPG